MPSETLYDLMLHKANDIEAEMKKLNRWSDKSLAPEKLEDMGAFGSSTMTFEEWLQYILIPRIHEIIKEKGDFPDGSMVATYAIRVFDGDPEVSELQNLLYELDELISQNSDNETLEKNIEQTVSSETEQVQLKSTVIPPVVFTIANLLPQFEGDALESQLQTFDVFIDVLSPEVRPVIGQMLKNAAAQTSNDVSKSRIERAATSIANGGMAAESYNHDDAMTKYKEEHRKSFPSN